MIVDARWYWDRSGREAFVAAHVPGAVFVDLDDDLTGAGSEGSGRQPFPAPSDFADAMSRAGIDGSRPVVAYDDAGGVIAARMVWMLRLLGVGAALISGGLQCFPGKLTTDISPIRPATFPQQPWPEGSLLTTQDVAELSGSVLMDARPSNRYRGDEPETDFRLGKVPEADPRRGHIPGAINVPCRNHLQHDTTIASPETVRATFADAGIVDAKNVVSYCGAGVTACHNLLAMEYAGLGRGRLYPGSWSAWSRATALPISTA